MLLRTSHHNGMLSDNGKDSLCNNRLMLWIYVT
jgi:hypothetical protein